MGAALLLVAGVSAQDGDLAPPSVAVADGPYVAPASSEARDALADFTVADGLIVELVAAEPLLANPVALDVDVLGRLWVAETYRHGAGVYDVRDHMTWRDDDLAAITNADRLALLRKHLGDEFGEAGLATERIRRLADTDGDGEADESLVFADGFDDPLAGIGAGVLARRVPDAPGGVDELIFTCIPDVWRLRDADGDGVADERAALSSGWGVRIAYLGHDLHGPVLGPDGRLYFSVGDRGFHVATPDGVLERRGQGAVLRCEPDGSRLEVVHAGLRNPQDLVFDDAGNLFTGDNNGDAGDAARWVHIVPGGDSGWRQPYQWLPDRGPWNLEGLWHRRESHDVPSVLPPVAHVGSGPSGVAGDFGTGFGPEWRGRLYVCDFLGYRSGSTVLALDLEARGASFALADKTVLLKGLQATDVAFGPDGALYVCDWGSGWGTTGKGRVYRVVDPGWSEQPLVHETQALLADGFAERDVDTLASLLGHADRRVRQGSHFELATRGERGLEALRAAAVGGADTATRLSGLWGTAIVARRTHDPALAEQARRTLRVLAGDRRPLLRVRALEALGELADAESSERIAQAIADDDPRVAFAAAVAAGRLGDARALDALVELARARGADDVYLRHAAVMGLVGCATPADFEALARDESAEVRLARVLALRRLGEPTLVDALADADPAVALAAARALHDELLDELADGYVPAPARPDAPGGVTREPEARRAALVAAQIALAERLPDVDVANRPVLRRALNAAVRTGDLPRAVLVSDLVARDDVDAVLRIEALERLRDWTVPDPRDPVVGTWRPLPERNAPWLPPLAVDLGARLEAADAAAPDEVLAAWAEFAGAAGALDTAPLLVALLEDAERESDLRVAALLALESLEADVLHGHIDAALADADPDLRAAALDVLQRLDPALALPRLPAVFEQGGVAELRVALGILGQAPSAYAAVRLDELLARLDAGLAPVELSLDIVLAAEAVAGAEWPELDGAARAALDAAAEQAEWSHTGVGWDAVVMGRAALREGLERHAARGEADELLQPWLDTLFGGDAAAGEDVFKRPALSCQRCHGTWDGAAATVGPNLFGVGGRLARLQLLESVVDPNRRTSPGYAGRHLVLTDGTTLSGRITDDGPEFVRIQDADGRERAVPLTDIARRREGLSAMPEGLGAGLTRSEMRDLLAYLAAL